MDKISFIRLWDTYRGLLTPVQREICDLYFNLDLTLSEIAEEKGITRQGVSECLKTCKKQFEEYEEKLQFVKKLDGYGLARFLMEREVRRWAENNLSSRPDLKSEGEKLLNILDKDYTDELEKLFADPDKLQEVKKDYAARTAKVKTDE